MAEGVFLAAALTGGIVFLLARQPRRRPGADTAPSVRWFIDGELTGVTFDREGISWTMSVCSSDRGDGKTVVEAPVGPGCGLEAASSDWSHWVERYPRIRGLGFRLGTTDLSWLRRNRYVLGEVLENLRGFSTASWHLLLTPGRVRAEIGRRLRPEEAAPLVELLARFVREAGFGQVAAGIFVLASGQDLHCPVCREPAEERVVHCRECGAPHHAECWSYVGNCALFGCGGRVAA